MLFAKVPNIPVQTDVLRFSNILEPEKLKWCTIVVFENVKVEFSDPKITELQVTRLLVPSTLLQLPITPDLLEQYMQMQLDEIITLSSESDIRILAPIMRDLGELVSIFELIEAKIAELQDAKIVDVSVPKIPL